MSASKTHRQWIKDARDRRNLSQEAAARTIGVSLRKFQRWEHGDSLPDDRFEAILALFPEVADNVRSELLPPSLFGDAEATQ